MTVLRSRNLLLRPFRPEDEATVLAYRNDPLVARFQGWPLPFTKTHFGQLLDPAGRLAGSGWTSWCICSGAGVQGDIGLRVHDGQAELGITLARSAQGRGQAAEALACITDHAFTELRLHRLHAGVDPANSAVIRLFTRAGWRHEGISRQSYCHRGVWSDEATYALLAEEWRAGP